jgi:hypothetical protein
VTIFRWTPTIVCSSIAWMRLRSKDRLGRVVTIDSVRPAGGPVAQLAVAVDPPLDERTTQELKGLLLLPRETASVMP